MPREQYELHWKDYYQLLGVRPDADSDNIHRIFRRLAQTYHSDVAGGGVDPERMKEINEAFEVLGNPERRSRYHAEWLRRSGMPNPSMTPTAVPSSTSPSESWTPPRNVARTDGQPVVATIGVSDRIIGVFVGGIAGVIAGSVLGAMAGTLIGSLIIDPIAGPHVDGGIVIGVGAAIGAATGAVSMAIAGAVSKEKFW